MQAAAGGEQLDLGPAGDHALTTVNPARLLEGVPAPALQVAA